MVFYTAHACIMPALIPYLLQSHPQPERIMMTIKVTPSKLLDLNFDEAEEGDLVQFTLADRSVLLATYAVNHQYSGHMLVVNRRHMPQALVTHIELHAIALLQRNDHNLKRWYCESDFGSTDPYDALVASLTTNCIIARYEVGKVPVVHLGHIGDTYGGAWRQTTSWEAPAEVVRIAPVEEWEGLRHAALLRAEALR